LRCWELGVGDYDLGEGRQGDLHNIIPCVQQIASAESASAILLNHHPPRNTVPTSPVIPASILRRQHANRDPTKRVQHCDPDAVGRSNLVPLPNNFIKQFPHFISQSLSLSIPPSLSLSIPPSLSLSIPPSPSLPVSPLPVTLSPFQSIQFSLIIMSLKIVINILLIVYSK